MPHRQIYKVRSPITCDVREKQRPQREDAMMEVTQNLILKKQCLWLSAHSRAAKTCQSEAEAETFSKANEQNTYKCHKASMCKVIVNQWETRQVSSKTALLLSCYFQPGV